MFFSFLVHQEIGFEASLIIIYHTEMSHLKIYEEFLNNLGSAYTVKRTLENGLGPEKISNIVVSLNLLPGCKLSLPSLTVQTVYRLQIPRELKMHKAGIVKRFILRNHDRHPLHEAESYVVVKICVVLKDGSRRVFSVPISVVNYHFDCFFTRSD